MTEEAGEDSEELGVLKSEVTAAECAEKLEPDVHAGRWRCGEGREAAPNSTQGDMPNSAQGDMPNAAQGDTPNWAQGAQASGCKRVVASVQRRRGAWSCAQCTYLHDA